VNVSLDYVTIVIGSFVLDAYEKMSVPEISGRIHLINVGIVTLGC